MKIAIIGTRNADGRSMLNAARHLLHGEYVPTQILTGGEGMPRLVGRKIAEELACNYNELKPEWEKYGRAAGPIRGKELISQADVVIAIWDGKSKGTEHELKEARRQGKRVRMRMI